MTFLDYCNERYISLTKVQYAPLGNAILIPVPKYSEYDFSFQFPFPKVGNAIFHSHSCSQSLGMGWSAEPFPFPFPNDQKSFPLTPSRSYQFNEAFSCDDAHLILVTSLSRKVTVSLQTRSSSYAGRVLYSCNEDYCRWPLRVKIGDALTNRNTKTRAAFAFEINIVWFHSILR